LRSAFGKLAHLIGNHGKTSPLFACPRGLDRRIKRQQIGLIGHFPNHVHHTGNAASLGLQLADFIRCGMHHHCHGAHLLNGVLNRLAAILSPQARRGSFRLGMPRALSDQIDADSQLFDCTGHRSRRLTALRRNMTDFFRCASQSFRFCSQDMDSGSNFLQGRLHAIEQRIE